MLTTALLFWLFDCLYFGEKLPAGVEMPTQRSGQEKESPSKTTMQTNPSLETCCVSEDEKDLLLQVSWELFSRQVNTTNCLMLSRRQSTVKFGSFS